jgi:hypothetical protein
MPSEVTKIRLCSNLLREPQVFDQLGEFASGVARDLIIYGVLGDEDETVLHLPTFCKTMGYTRQLLMKPMSDEQKGWLKAHGYSDRAIEVARVAIGYVLLRMGKDTLHFEEERERQDGDKPARKTLRFDYKMLVSRIDVDILSTGTMLYYSIDADILAHGRGKWYQALTLEDYLSFTTPAGRADHQARKMYLRLVWKRRYWDKTPKRAGYYPSKDSYTELCAVAGLHFQDEKQNAARLRKLLTRVAAAPSIKMIPKVKLNYETGKYEVTWKREYLPSSSISDGKPAKVSGRAKVA